jgi:hypothetical protein
MQPGESLRELCRTANFVYITVYKVDTGCIRKLIILQILVFFRELTDSGPDSILGIMIASCIQ